MSGYSLLFSPFFCKEYKEFRGADRGYDINLAWKLPSLRSVRGTEAEMTPGDNELAALSRGGEGKGPFPSPQSNSKGCREEQKRHSFVIQFEFIYLKRKV